MQVDVFVLRRSQWWLSFPASWHSWHVAGPGLLYLGNGGLHIGWKKCFLREGSKSDRYALTKDGHTNFGLNHFPLLISILCKFLYKTLGWSALSFTCHWILLKWSVAKNYDVVVQRNALYCNFFQHGDLHSFVPPFFFTCHCSHCPNFFIHAIFAPPTPGLNQRVTPSQELKIGNLKYIQSFFASSAQPWLH